MFHIDALWRVIITIARKHCEHNYLATSPGCQFSKSLTSNKIYVTVTEIPINVLFLTCLIPM